MTTAILRVYPNRQPVTRESSNRQPSDVRITRVTRVPGCAAEHDNLSPISSCEKCGMVPLYDPDPTDPKVPVELRLSMVMVPDRDGPLFLGPTCIEAEVARYVNGYAP